MSSIDGVSGSGVDISTLRQMLARQESVCECASLGGDETKEERRLAFEEAFTEAALAAGLDPEAADGLQDEIRSAIAEALKSSEDQTDRQQVVRDAVDGVLEEHGVDLEAFKSRMEPPHGKAGGPPPEGPPPDGAGQTEVDSQFLEAALAAGLDPEAADGLQDEIEAAIEEALRSVQEAADPRQLAQKAVDGVLEKNGVDLGAFQSQLWSAIGGTQLIDEQA